MNEHFVTLPPTKLFFRCAIPAMIGMIVSASYAIADGIFVGHFIGSEALAAVNLIMPFTLIAFSLADMIAVGSSVRISMFLGQGKHKDANQTFSFCLKVIFLISILIGIVGFLLGGPLLELMGAEALVLQYAQEYLCVYAIFAPGVMLFFATDNYLRICGKEKYSMAIIVFTSVLNIILDFLLIVVWKQGVWSAALASCLSMTLGTVLSLAPFLHKKLDLHFTHGNISPSQFMKLLANGSSEFFSSIAGSTMSIIINAILLAIGGTTAVAAISVVMYADNIVNMLIFGMVSSLQPAIIYCYGAGLQKRVKALQKRIIVAAALLSLLAFFFMRYGGGLVVPLFVQPDDSALLTMSMTAMSLYAFAYLVNWVDGCLSGYLTALEHPGRSLAVSLLGTIVFPTICLALMVPSLGLNGVWLMPFAAGILSAIAALVAVNTLKQKDYRILTINKERGDC